MKKMITRRQFMAAAGVVAAASALTACGGSSASTAASSAAGSTAGSAAASGSTIKVGVLGPMTGDVSVYGLAVINGATLYLKRSMLMAVSTASSWRSSPWTSRAMLRRL